jgi:hypothetical protein
MVLDTKNKTTEKNMANATMTLTQNKAQVAYAVLTGAGRKGKKKENEYVLAIEVTPEQRENLLDKLNEFWAENKTPKAKKPSHAFEDLFTESKSNKENFVFWGAEVVSGTITRKRAEGTNWTMQNFADLGQGSVVDAEYRAFYYNNDFGEGLGLRLSAVCLHEFVKYSGSNSGASLQGETLEDDGLVTTTHSAAQEDSLAGVIKDFQAAIDDEDFDEAEDLLEELEDHDDYKSFKSQLRKARQ